MAWMRDEYEKIVGHPAPGVITGKPLDQGGSKVRDIATALGGVYVLEQALEKLQLEEKTVVIQGFGNAGMNAAKLLAERGFSDSKGGVYNQAGLNVEELIRVKTETRTVTNYEAEKITNEQLLELPCTVLIPSALDGVLHVNNAGNVKAKIVLELANGPTTAEADDVLHKNNVLVLPDILANSGGVTVSYFEWLQNNKDEYWEAPEVQNRLREKMVAAFTQLWDAYSSNEYDFRTNTYIHAMKKVLAAERQRGKL